MNLSAITLQEIALAHERIRPYIRHTPLEYSEEFSYLYSSNVYLKLENLQLLEASKPGELLINFCLWIKQKVKVV
ncbi:threonine dehydratase [Bacillus freudenreichii]|nr:threonine dehydratase [Bacillus freudenreichii]